MVTLKAIISAKSITLFILLNLTDLILTLLLLSWGGTELNPIYASLGQAQFITIAKIAFIALAVFFLWNFRMVHLFKPLNIGMGVVVAFNIIMMIRGFWPV